MPTPDEMYDEANNLKEQGDLAAAVAKLNEILAIDPNHVLSHSALAVYQQRLGALDEAIAHAIKVTELEPSDPLSVTQLSVIYQRCGRITEAEDAMAKVREIQAAGGHGH